MQELNGTTPTANLLTGLGIDEVWQRTTGSTVRTFLADGLGSTLALTDATGAVQTSYTYEPFGKTTASGASSTNAFKYTGREDDTTGLYYYRARYYYPGFQRFVSEDPIGFAGRDVNLYGYVRNDPANATDPLGLEVNYSPRAGGSVDARTSAGLECLHSCLGRDLTVTGGREGYPHKPKGAHPSGQACDLGKKANPDLPRDDVEACFYQCYPGTVLWGYEGTPNSHLQTRPNAGGGTGFEKGIKNYGE